MTPASPFVTAPSISHGQFRRVLDAFGSPWAPDSESHYDLIAGNGHDPGRWLGIGVREHRLLTDPDAVALRLATNSWTNARSVRHPDLDYDIITTAMLREAGITNRNGPYVRYRSVADSLRDGMYRVTDPTYVYQIRYGPGITIAETLSTWTEDDAAGYIASVIGNLNSWIDEDGSPPMGLSETIMGRIAARGVEIHDIRGQLERHASKSPETRPNTAWRYTAVHHTAVSRGMRGLAGDIESWQGHARHHVINNGWPAIAYFLGFSQSGRAFLLRDVHEVGYHAFAGANYQTLATCGDLHITNAPTPQLLASYEAGLRVLHEQTPELPNLIGHTGTYGHQELTFLDPQNSTACPGQLLQWVRDYREQVGPKNDPNARHFPETGHWIVNLPNAKMLDLWLELGGVKSEGYPLGGMVLDNDGVYRQLTENSLLEIWPDETGRRGGLGQRYRKLMDAAGQLRLAAGNESAVA